MLRPAATPEDQAISSRVILVAGSFGCVHLVKRKSDEETVVLKIIARPQDSSLNNFIQNEIDVNQKLARLYTRSPPPLLFCTHVLHYSQEPCVFAFVR